MEAERIARGGLELSTEDSPEPTCSSEFVEPSNARGEARVLPVPTREGTFEGVAVASVEHVVIIMQEFSVVVTEPFEPPPS